jgi:hypothetical protein
MCLGDEFKLCSCDADKLSEEEIGWVLERIDQTIVPTATKKGKCKQPPPSTVQQLSIVEELNSRNCFDFELCSDASYLLKVRLPDSNQWHKFTRFPSSPPTTLLCGSPAVWTHDRSSKFARWRAQLVKDSSGVVANVGLAAALQRLAFAAAIPVAGRSNGFALAGGLAERLSSLDLPFVADGSGQQHPLIFEAGRQHLRATPEALVGCTAIRAMTQGSSTFDRQTHRKATVGCQSAQWIPWAWRTSQLRECGDPPEGVPADELLHDLRHRKHSKCEQLELEPEPESDGA